jgi:hypothetical protein
VCFGRYLLELTSIAFRPPLLNSGDQEELAEGLRRLFEELMASRSDRRLPNLVGCKAREADGLMRRRRANFHHGWNETKFRSEAEYMPATGYQISTATPCARGWVHVAADAKLTQGWSEPLGLDTSTAPNWTRS